jgi:protein-S-isoprenylcysteine O-methyltransferase Ste14
MAGNLERSWLWRARATISFLILAPAIAAATFSAVRFAPGSYAELGLTTLGWLVFLIGGSLRWWATLYIGGRKDRLIVDDGPYSICRHPLYLGTLLLACSVALFLQSVTLAVGIVAVLMFFVTVTIPAEETRLEALYGATYVRYRRRVPMLWPRMGNFRSPRKITIEVRGLAAEMKRSARWLAIPVACHLLLHLRAFEWWPHWLPLS